MVYPGLNHGGGLGGLQYRGPGTFHPRGVSICAASAGSDITRCNSAGGIIDLSVGSRHQSRPSAAAGAGKGARAYPDWAVFAQIGASCLALRGLRAHVFTCVGRRTWTVPLRLPLANFCFKRLALAMKLGCSFSDH